MSNRNDLTPTPIIDKNGRATTVYRKKEGVRALRGSAAPAPVNNFTDEDARALVADLMAKLVTPSSLNWDSVKQDLHYIDTWEHDWTDAEKRNLLAIASMAEVLDVSVFTADVESEANDIVASLEPAVVSQERIFRGFNDKRPDPNANNWRARDKMLHDLADDLLARRRVADVSYEPVEPVTNPRMFGLEDAQNIAFERVNRPEFNRDGTTQFGDVESYLQESIARAVRGDTTPELFPERRNESDLGLLPESERILGAFSKDEDGDVLKQQLYLALVFPVNEMKDEMDRVGIDNVSVSSFYNTREWGNVYTVMTPDGSTRSFSIYEHRNTDSIIINGLADWDGEGIPYAADSKNEFFGEFAPGDFKRVAQSLVFYMMQAQKGELNDDDTLVRNAPHRDWNAILDAAIPGFKEWRQAKVSDTYIAPADESEDELLNRLDFSAE